MLAYASCRGAIKAGHNLNMYQMTTLIEDLFSTEKPYVCPSWSSHDYQIYT